MIKDTVTVEEAIERLNKLWKNDPNCVAQLLQRGVACNETMVLDDDVVAQGVSPENIKTVGSEYMIGPLALINALFGKECGIGPIGLDFYVACPGRCNLGSFADLLVGEPCPLCGGHELEFGGINEVKPFKDSRGAIEEFRDYMNEQGSA